jgi:hypothetical protein
LWTAEVRKVIIQSRALQRAYPTESRRHAGPMNAVLTDGSEPFGAMGEDQEEVATLFAIRDDTQAHLAVPSSEHDAHTSDTSSDQDRKKTKLKKILSGSRLKDKMHDLSNAREEKLEASSRSPSLQDRLFSKSEA